MNQKTRDWLAELAHTLPIVYENKTVRATYVEAKQRYKKAKPTDTWLKTERRPVDHLKHLRIAYSQGREAAVEAYRVKALELSVEQSKEKPKPVQML